MKCVYCKEPNPPVVKMEEWEGFTIKTMYCRKCRRNWKDFGGDAVLSANKEPPKQLDKHDNIPDNSA